MKKFLKILGIGILSLIILGVGSCFFMSEKLPEGIEGPEAEALTDKMFEAINKEAWDTTKIVTWNFMGMHDYLWNKETTDLQVKWGDTEVNMNLKEYDGVVMQKGSVLEGDEKRKAIDKAYGFFCNDMFWLNAPVKARDEGTTRKVVDLKEGGKGLLVSYTSGGVTPGDSYLWILDENGLPSGYKMWTKVLPLQGAYASWDNWKTLDTGAKLASTRGTKIYEMSISGIDSGQTYEDLGVPNPFAK